jgi:hypothetical protein
MPTSQQSRAAMVLVADRAVADAVSLITTDPRATRDRLLVATPEIVSYYSDGTAALAADQYDDLRFQANVAGSFTAEPVIDLREERIRRGVLWSVEPLYGVTDIPLATERLGQVVQYETANPYRDTITTNTRRDPRAVGWRRIAGGGCQFCNMLAGRGAVYTESSAHFASHPHCRCSAEPVFDGERYVEASELQNLGSHDRTAAEQEELNAAL